MKTYEVQFYTECSYVGVMIYTSRSNKQAIKNAIKLNKINGNNKYIQVWRIKKINFIKIFGNGNTYLFGKNKGKKVDI